MHLAILIGLYGCTSPSVVGQVVDHTGRGIAGAEVIARESTQAATTDAEGRFEIEGLVGPQVLQFEHPDYFPESLDAQLSGETLTVLEPTALLRVPSAPGLYVIQQRRAVALSAATLKREIRTQRGEKRRRFCLSEPSMEMDSLPAGETLFLAHDAPPWRLFRLDEENCAYRDERDAAGRWSVKYRNKPRVQAIRGETEAQFSIADLEGGAYFIADWGGFFVPSPETDDRYSGRLLRIDG